MSSGIETILSGFSTLPSLSHELDKDAIEQFIASADISVQQICRKIINATIHVSFKEFISKFENIIKEYYENYKDFHINEQRPVYVFKSTIKHNSNKSNYWFADIAINLLENLFSKHDVTIKTLGDFDIRNNSDLKDDDIIIFTDDCIYSGNQLGQKYINEPELWLETEAMVREVLIETGTPFVEVQDEGAFYGPKIDVQIWSIIGREFTLATNQVDFAQGKRFNLNFTNKDNEPETPLIIHRAPLGTHERFIGFLLEHYAGKFPVWLAPLQVKILPISEKFLPYAEAVMAEFKKSGVRVEIDDRNEKIGKKIRDTEIMKVPYMLVIGEKEVSENKLSVRRQGKGDMGMLDKSAFLAQVVDEIAQRLAPTV